MPMPVPVETVTRRRVSYRWKGMRRTTEFVFGAIVGVGLGVVVTILFCIAKAYK